MAGKFSLFNFPTLLNALGTHLPSSRKLAQMQYMHSTHAAGLAQSVECLTAEREVAGSISRGRTITQGLKITEK